MQEQLVSADEASAIHDLRPILKVLTAKRTNGITPAPAWNPPRTLDARGRVMRDILGYFRVIRADAGDALDFPTFETYIMRYYTPGERDAFDQAVDELAVQGLVERQGRLVYLTQRGQQAIARIR